VTGISATLTRPVSVSMNRDTDFCAAQEFVSFQAKVPAAKTPNWGEGSHFANPGFYSGDTAGWNARGNVSVKHNDRGNFHLEHPF
jgi:hypothetical protein